MPRALERLQALMPATGSATQAQCRQASVARPPPARQPPADKPGGARKPPGGDIPAAPAHPATRLRAYLPVTAIMHPVRNMPTSRANPDMRLNEPSS